MQKYVGDLAKYPARTALAWYLGVAAVGTLLLWLPVSRQDRRAPVSLVDAAFTATSATCVTGLTVRSTANDFSFFGQVVILVLVLVLCGWWRFRGVATGSVFRRSISRRSVERAVTTALLFGAVAAVGLAVLLIAEQSSHANTSDLDFLDASFEVTSALGTVGLSTGLTRRLSDLGKLVVMLLMLTGWLGPVSVLLALSRVEEPSRLEFPEEEVLVG